MCIVVCIGMFFDFIFINKIIVLMLFIGSYYRTIKCIPFQHPPVFIK